MKTLSRAVSQHIFTTPESRDAFIAQWKSTGHKVATSAEHHLLASAFLGKDWTKGFTAIGETPKPKKGETVAYYRQVKDRDGNLKPLKEHIVNVKGQRKLANGMQPNASRNSALYYILRTRDTERLLEPFPTVTVKMLQVLRALLPTQKMLDAGDSYDKIVAEDLTVLTESTPLPEITAKSTKQYLPKALEQQVVTVGVHA